MVSAVSATAVDLRRAPSSTSTTITPEQISLSGDACFECHFPLAFFLRRRSGYLLFSCCRSVFFFHLASSPRLSEPQKCRRTRTAAAHRIHTPTSDAVDCRRIRSICCRHEFVPESLGARDRATNGTHGNTVCADMETNIRSMDINLILMAVIAEFCC